MFTKRLLHSRNDSGLPLDVDDSFSSCDGRVWRKCVYPMMKRFGTDRPRFMTSRVWKGIVSTVHHHPSSVRVFPCFCSRKIYIELQCNGNIILLKQNPTTDFCFQRNWYYWIKDNGLVNWYACSLCSPADEKKVQQPAATPTFLRFAML